MKVFTKFQLGICLAACIMIVGGCSYDEVMSENDTRSQVAVESVERSIPLEVEENKIFESENQTEISKDGVVCDTKDALVVEETFIAEEKEIVDKSEDKVGNVVDKNAPPTVEEQKITYVVTDLNVMMYASTAVNVREEPDKNSDKLGSLTENQEVNVTGKTDNGWYRISYNGADAFVNSSYLMQEKKVVQEPPKTTPSPSVDGNSSSSSAGGSVTVPKKEDTQGNLVWVPTKGGKKYHSKSSCSSMDNPMQVTIEHAEANGYTPCKRCY